MRKLRLFVNKWHHKVLGFRESLLTYYYQRTCPHLFRAALVGGQPGRVCKICDLSQELSQEDFYAHFGEKYQSVLHTEPLSSAVIGDTRVTQESSLLH